MSKVELIIYRSGNTSGTAAGGVRCTVNKWKFQDKMMGEQFVSFNITSEKPIDWSIGDYCLFRGETYTLNYVPTVTQKSRTGERQDAYTYESVKLESRYEELTRCIMLDIIPTSSLHRAILGTNYTGSSKFQLFCGETSYDGMTYTAVCALALKMQANLDRMYGAGLWTIDVDTTTSYTNASGVTQLMTHTDDKTLTFDNTTVAKALEEVHNIFKLDYCVKGRMILIGHRLRNLTSDNESDAFAFGYGKGYPTRDDMGTGLFKLKRVANSQQKIVTRLRAMGSTKNMPYRYYNGKYGLSQSLFPTNLQLPNTFENAAKKAEANASRDELYGVNALNNLPYVRHVQGETNDSYIDKDDNAEGCAEGLREDSARWDGSNSDLPEIYPTIEEVTFGDLRGNGVVDQSGGNFDGYGDNEHVDEILAVGYKNGSAMIDDANIGNGILTENGEILVGNRTTCLLEETRVGYSEFTLTDNGYAGPEKNVFIINDVYPGKYTLTPALSTTYWGMSLYNYTRKNGRHTNGANLEFTVKQRSKDTGVITTLFSYRPTRYRSISDGDLINLDDDWNFIGIEKWYAESEMPQLPLGVGETFAVTEFSDIILTVTPYVSSVQNAGMEMTDMQLAYWIGRSKKAPSDVTPEYHLVSADSDESNNGSTFHVFIKDMGFDIRACFTSEDPVMSMKSGRCVGRDFTICQNVEKVTYDGKLGYMLTLKRKEDTGLNTYYPSYTDQIAAGDKFVLLNINMPDAYIEAAEMRLLRAATDYLSDNCETKFTYQPSIDDIYLQRNLDICRKENRESDSIFWRLYAGLKFTFIARFSSGDENLGDELVSAELTIEQVTIQMGDGLTPKVEIRLNDDVQQSTLQKLTTSIDRIYSGSIFNGGNGVGGGASTAQLMSLIQSEGEKQFLSKRHDDIARGVIGFLGGLWVQAKGLFGIDEEGHITGSSLKATGTSGNTVTDTDSSTQKNLGLEVAESGIIGGILRVAKSIMTKTIQSLNFTGGDSLFGTGWQVTDDDGNGNSRLVVDNLFVRMKAVFNELEVRKFVSMGGNYVFSPAASIIEEVDYIDANGNVLGYEYVKVPWVLRLVPLSLAGKFLSRKKFVRSTMSQADWGRVKVFRCWIKADDGTTRTINTWQVGMLARCQTFDVSQGSGTQSDIWYGQNVKNKLYWRAVTAIGAALTKQNYNLPNHILDDGMQHNYIDLANFTDGDGVRLYLSGSDNPEALDNIVCFGDWKDELLSNLITIETVGSEAPCFKEMLGVGYTDGKSISWSLSDEQVRTRISPIAGNRFVADDYVVVTPDGNVSLKVALEGIKLRVENEFAGLSTALGLTSEEASLAAFVGALETAGIHISGQNKSIELRADKVRFTNSNGTVDNGVSINPTDGTIVANGGTFTNITVTGGSFTNISATGGTFTNITVDNGVLTSKSVSNNRKVMIDADLFGVSMYGKASSSDTAFSEKLIELNASRIYVMQSNSDDYYASTSFLKLNRYNESTKTTTDSMELYPETLRFEDSANNNSFEFGSYGFGGSYHGTDYGTVAWYDLAQQMAEQRLKVEVINDAKFDAGGSGYFDGNNWSYDVGVGKSFIVCNFNYDDIVIYLPDPTDCEGKMYFVKNLNKSCTIKAKSNSYFIEQDGTSRNSSDGVTAGSMIYVSDGSEWIAFCCD